MHIDAKRYDLWRRELVDLKLRIDLIELQPLKFIYILPNGRFLFYLEQHVPLHCLHCALKSLALLLAQCSSLSGNLLRV